MPSPFFDAFDEEEEPAMSLTDMGAIYGWCGHTRVSPKDVPAKRPAVAHGILSRRRISIR